jgi:hypothetical protein
LDAIPLGSAPVSRITYSDLFNVIGVTYGEGLTGELTNWNNAITRTGFQGWFINDNRIMVTVSDIPGKIDLTDVLTGELLYQLVVSGTVIGVTGADNSDTFFMLNDSGYIYAYSLSEEYGYSHSGTVINNSLPKYNSLKSITYTKGGLIVLHGNAPYSTAGYLLTEDNAIIGGGTLRDLPTGVSGYGYSLARHPIDRNFISYQPGTTGLTQFDFGSGAPTTLPNLSDRLFNLTYDATLNAWLATVYIDAISEYRLIKYSVDFTTKETVDMLWATNGRTNIPHAFGSVLGGNVVYKVQETGSDELRVWSYLAIPKDETFGIPSRKLGLGKTALSFTKDMVHPIGNRCNGGVEYRNGSLFFSRHYSSYDYQLVEFEISTGTLYTTARLLNADALYRGRTTSLSGSFAFGNDTSYYSRILTLSRSTTDAVFFTTKTGAKAAGDFAIDAITFDPNNNRYLVYTGSTIGAITDTTSTIATGMVLASVSGLYLRSLLYDYNNKRCIGINGSATIYIAKDDGTGEYYTILAPSLVYGSWCNVQTGEVFVNTVDTIYRLEEDKLVAVTKINPTLTVGSYMTGNPDNGDIYLLSDNASIIQVYNGVNVSTLIEYIKA